MYGWVGKETKEMKNTLTAMLILAASVCSAQGSANGTPVSGGKGIVRGTVYEESTGFPLIAANVVLQGTTTGTITDLDGVFSLELPAGKHNLQISFITFQTLTITDVEVKPGEVTNLGDIMLKENTQLLEEVVVTAEAVRKSETALMKMKQKSVVMMDGISSSRLQLTGDGNGADAAKRVTGVTVEGGKYVYVRGLGDRYTKTTLNGVDIPGLDPDKNSLQMDIFPTNLIDNIVVSKNFTADMPADFTGGLVNLETKSFPDEKFITISAGVAYNPDMHFNPNYLTYEGGKTDFLGFDDGTRALPDRARGSNVPTPISGASAEEVNAFVKEFDPQLAATRKTSPMDYNLGLSYGNQISLGEGKASDPKIGYIISLAYKATYKYYDDVIYGEYQRYKDPDRYELRYATIQQGELGQHDVLVGALGGVAYKTQYSKIRLTAMHLQNGTSSAGKFSIDNDGEAVGQSGYYALSDNLEYNQRSLSNIFLGGSHFTEKSGWELDWKISPTYSTSSDPDIRKTAFTITPVDTLFVAGAGGNPSRIWRYLSEVNATAKVDLAKSYKFNGRESRLKFGASHTYKYRDYEILFFDIQFTGSQSWPNPDPAVVLSDENLYPNRPNGIYYQSGNNNPNPNEYQSNVNNSGVYVSNELKVLPRLNTILGLRAENYVQRHTGRDQRYASGDKINGRNLDNEVVLNSLDLFPTANLIYQITENQNLRGGYSKTIARPSFKELSFAQILDPITNRIFNGSLFTYRDWDGKLTETRIHNIDLRWEMFMENGQTFSVSAFYKDFDNPIELVRIPEQQTSTEYQPRNVGDGRLYGLELEMRKDLGFLDEGLKDFNLNANLTIVESQIDMTDLEYNSRKSYEKTGENIKRQRQMAGQSPYVVNAGLSYNDIDRGIDAGIFYNVKGPTLIIVGAGLFPDIYSEPFHSLDFSILKKFGEDQRFIVDLKVSNILNDRLESFYKSFRPDSISATDATLPADATKKPFSSLNPGRTFSIGMSYKL
ncbi:MAG: TonB-dependent receptor [Salibacteraceae bacterium]